MDNALGSNLVAAANREAGEFRGAIGAVAKQLSLVADPGQPGEGGRAERSSHHALGVSKHVSEHLYRRIDL